MGTEIRPRNRRTAGFLTALVVGGVALGASQPASAAVIRVPQDQPTIQQAENAAQPGDLIKIRTGTYDESVEVNVSNVRFLGAGGRVIVDADGSGQEAFDISAANVTLQNLTARNGEDDGIQCDGESCTLRSVTVDGDTVGDRVADNGGDNLLVTGSRMTGCSNGAIDAAADGVQIRSNSARLIGGTCYFVAGDNAVVQRNLAQSCESGDGIFIAAGGDGPRIDANIVRLASDIGINFGPVQNPVVTRNLIQSVGDDGIFLICVVACGSGLVQRNVVTGTLSGTGNGFDIHVADNTGTFRILNNTASRVGGSGFNLTDLFDALLRGNVSNRVGATGGSGFRLTDSDNNHLINNTALRGAGAGFELNDDSDSNTLRGNVVYRNQGEGLDVATIDANDNLLDRNTATKNSQNGINNGGTNTDLTNNRASGNGGVDCITEPAGSVDLNTGNRCADGTGF